MQGATTPRLGSRHSDSAQGRPLLVRGGLYAAALAGLWGLLNDWAPASWVVGGPVIALASWAACVLPAGRLGRLRPGATLRFALFFFSAGLAGAVEVARRAFHPALPLAPGLLHYRLRLPEGPARVLLANVTSLLPGTLSAELQGATLTIHALVMRPSVLEATRTLEERLAAMFGLTLREELRS